MPPTPPASCPPPHALHGPPLSDVTPPTRHACALHPLLCLPPASRHDAPPQGVMLGTALLAGMHTPSLLPPCLQSYHLSPPPWAVRRPHRQGRGLMRPSRGACGEPAPHRPSRPHRGQACGGAPGGHCPRMERRRELPRISRYIHHMPRISR